MRELLTGRCDMVISGGASVFSAGVLNLVFCQLNALSRKGQIRPFDQRADGTLLGSGVGMVLLKRLDDAERDHVLAGVVVEAANLAPSTGSRATGASPE